MSRNICFMNKSREMIRVKRRVRQRIMGFSFSRLKRRLGTHLPKLRRKPTTLLPNPPRKAEVPNDS